MNIGYFCSECKKEYKCYASLWNHNKIKHNGIRTVKNEYTAESNDVSLFACRNCTKTYKHKQSRYNHEKVCTGIEINNSESEKYDKQIAILNQEHANIELKIKLHDLKNVKKNEKKMSINESVVFTNNLKAEQYIYLLQTREFLNSNQPIYKIGKTTKSNFIRFNQYPNGSVLLFQSSCYDCNELERRIINLFTMRYKICTLIGREYFEGDSRNMIMDLCNLVNEEIIDKNDNSLKIDLIIEN
jgi:hypothetical protein